MFGGRSERLSYVRNLSFLQSASAFCTATDRSATPKLSQAREQPSPRFRKGGPLDDHRGGLIATLHLYGYGRGCLCLLFKFVGRGSGGRGPLQCPRFHIRVSHCGHSRKSSSRLLRVPRVSPACVYEGRRVQRKVQWCKNLSPVCAVLGLQLLLPCLVLFGYLLLRFPRKIAPLCAALRLVGLPPWRPHLPGLETCHLL